MIIPWRHLWSRKTKKATETAGTFFGWLTKIGLSEAASSSSQFISSQFVSRTPKRSTYSNGVPDLQKIIGLYTVAETFFMLKKCCLIQRT